MSTSTQPLPHHVRVHRIRAVWLIAGLLAAAALALVVDRTVFSQGAQPARPDLQRILDGLVTGRGRVAPGVTAYVSGPHGSWVGSAGTANVATGEPMRPDARVRLESVSKLWTSALILQLVGDRRLRLDDTVERWVPGLLPYGHRITVEQLLNHTSGMVDTNDIGRKPTYYLAAVKDPALRATLATLARRVATDQSTEFSPRVWIEWAAALPLEYPPNTTYHYSNIGYMVAGLIAERAGGATLATLLRQRIIEPLHLTSAAYDPSPQISGSHAHGYRVAGDGTLTDATTWTKGLGANGGMVSDAADEARFLQALMRGEILKPAQLSAMKQPSAFTNYGMGVSIDESLCGGTAYGHNGGGDGFGTNVHVSGDGNRVAVLLFNGRTADRHGDSITYDAMQRFYCAA